MSEAPFGAKRFEVRQATTRDMPYVRAWLPDALGGSPAALIGMAIETSTGAIAGCGSLRFFTVDRAGRFLVHVDPTFRRQGCGTVLLECIRHLARRLNTERLLTGRSYPAEADSDEKAAAMNFFGLRGMSVGQDILRYLCRTELWSHLLPN